MQSWQLNGPKLVKFGPRVRNEVIPLAKALARRAIVLVGSRTLRQSSLCQQWLEDFQKQLPVECSLQLPAREPQVDDVNHLAHSLRELSAGPDDVVIVVGGGSSIDMVKAACGLATQKEVRSCQDYLEGVGTGAKLIQAPLRWIALPTTAGTGAEATRNAVISSNDSSTSTPFKKSFRSDELYAQAVFLDPEWTLSLPRKVTISSGLDALTQLLESAISSRATPYTFMLSQQGLAWGLPAFEQLLQEPENLDARGKMLSAAYLSGVALANSGLGAAHGVAAGLGAMLPVPHGLACAVMLPHTLAHNFSTSHSALEIMARSAGFSAKANASAATQLIERITHLVHQCEIPQRLRNLGVTQEMIPQLVELSQGNSLQGNPRPISPAELEQWLCSIW